MLLVDDNPKNLQVLFQTLEAQGHEVTDVGCPDTDRFYKFPSIGERVARELQKDTAPLAINCCGSGTGLNTDEYMDMRMRGGLPRASAVKHVHEKHGVDLLSCVCAIDRATLPPLMEYWVPGVEVSGVHELVGNALVMDGENDRTLDLRGNSVNGNGADDGNGEAEQEGGPDA